MQVIATHSVSNTIEIHLVSFAIVNIIADAIIADVVANAVTDIVAQSTITIKWSKAGVYIST